MDVLCPAHSKFIIQVLVCCCLVHLDVGICLMDMLALAIKIRPQIRCKYLIFVMGKIQLTLSIVQIHNSKLPHSITITLQSGTTTPEILQYPFREIGFQKVYSS